MCEGYGELKGDTEVTPGALLLMLARRRRQSALDDQNTPRGPKTIKGGSHNNQQVEEDAWVQNEDGRGRVSRIKLQNRVQICEFS